MSFLDTLFGSPEGATSNNKAYPWIKDNYGASGAGAFNSGLGGLMGLLGLGGDPNASSAALDNYWKSSGGDFQLNQGVNAINSNMYSRGLGQSGAAMKGLEGYRSGLASTKLNEIMQNYLGVANLGLGAGGLVANAGQQEKKSGATPGLASLLAFI